MQGEKIVCMAYKIPWCDSKRLEVDFQKKKSKYINLNIQNNKTAVEKIREKYFLNSR